VLTASSLAEKGGRRLGSVGVRAAVWAGVDMELRDGGERKDLDSRVYPYLKMGRRGKKDSRGSQKTQRAGLRDKKISLPDQVSSKILLGRGKRGGEVYFSLSQWRSTYSRTQVRRGEKKITKEMNHRYNPQEKFYWSTKRSKPRGEGKSILP